MQILVPESSHTAIEGGVTPGRTLAYRPAIDGLRAIAVVAVMIFHLNHAWLPGGFVGVDVFFVISGYLITSIILRQCEAGSFSLKTFYQHRIARIFPAFIVVALATLVAARFIYSPHDLANAAGDLKAASLSIANLQFMLQGNYFVMSPDAQPYLHYWSLSVEEQFYFVFPLFFLLLFKIARKHLVLVLGILLASSSILCVALTVVKPEWAFYLPMSRAWELLAGSLLAVIAVRTSDPASHRWRSLASIGGGILIGISLVLVREGKHFPGFLAMMPVVGAIGALVPQAGGKSLFESFLALPPMALVGKISYSLYLWHWPVFSLVDYRMVFASELTRVFLKIGITLGASILGFLFIEKPARALFNRPQNQVLAFISTACLIGATAWAGYAVSDANYVNAKARDVARGGLHFNSSAKGGAVMLMGDSDAAMYGKTVRDLCVELDRKFTAICVTAKDPLPSTNELGEQLWKDSLAIVKKEKPDYLVLSCLWALKLENDRGRLQRAVDALRPNVGHLIILNEPPLLPGEVTRAAIRNGLRPPFFEDPKFRQDRNEVNDYLARFNNGNCVVIDIASRFESSDGEVLFLDPKGRPVFHDSFHLSQFGVDLVRSDLKQALSR